MNINIDKSFNLFQVDIPQKTECYYGCSILLVKAVCTRIFKFHIYNHTKKQVLFVNETMYFQQRVVQTQLKRMNLNRKGSTKIALLYQIRSVSKNQLSLFGNGGMGSTKIAHSYQIRSVSRNQLSLFGNGGMTLVLGSGAISVTSRPNQMKLK